MEGLALTGASVDIEEGLLSTIVLEMGGSSDLCALLKPGEPVVLMGPTGTPSETPPKETALLIGGGLGNAVLFSIGQKLRRKVPAWSTSRATRKSSIATRSKKSRRPRTLWSGAATKRPASPLAACGRVIRRQHRGCHGRLRPGQFGEAEIPLHSVDRLLVIGSDGMMRAVQQARHGVLAPFLKPDHHAIGSINSPMQCMMKEICAQCLQTHRDPITGEETVVFSCFNQDQPLDHVDFVNLRTRLTQNGAQEKLTKLWIDHCMREIGAR